MSILRVPALAIVLQGTARPYHLSRPGLTNYNYKNRVLSCINMFKYKKCNPDPWTEICNRLKKKSINDFIRFFWQNRNRNRSVFFLKRL